MLSDYKVKDIEINLVELEAMGLGIDTLTEDQIRYRDSYTEGT